MPAKEMSMDDFLEHTGSESGGGSILKWKEDGEVDVLLHPKAPYYGVWSHSWYSVVKDRETGNDKIIFTRWNSYESEKVLARGRFRSDGAKEADQHQYPWNGEPVLYHGIRENPPEVCPFSLLVEWVREQIDHTQTIDWTERIFDVDLDGGDDNSQIIHAGGFTGLFGARDLEKDELAILRKKGIRRDEAYKEDGKPRLQYVFCVVPYARPADGPVVCIEAEALGKKFKQQIKDLRDDSNDPREKPVVFRWKYDDDQEFSAKYSVAVRRNDPIGEEHRAALATDFPRDRLERITADGNLVELRRNFERWWCHKVTPPWDAIFAPALKAYAGKPQAQDPDAEQREEKVPAAAGKSAPAPAEAEDDDQVECANPACLKPMSETDEVCGSCGAVYAEDGTWTLPAPKAETKKRSRGAAAATAKS